MSVLIWNTAAVRALAMDAIESSLEEFSLRLEQPAKSKLVAGAGVLTGTYRRSLHGDSPDFNWQSDNVTPSPSSPERGGKVAVKVTVDSVTLTFGSGLNYAAVVEKRYGTIQQAHNQLWPTLPAIIKKHAIARGLV